MAATEETAPDDLGIEYLRDATPVGRGGFAHVYAATDTRFDRRVAVKVFDHLLTDDDRALFEAECRTTGRLWRIPNIITFHDVEYTADGQPCIVMAYLEDGSLGDLLRRQGLIPWRRAVGYLVTVLEALDAAHREGVLHRDIKPENILLEGDEAYLTDFGLATVKTPGGGTDVGTAQVIASPLHAPPETFDGGTRDERSDVYSAASTLYNLIAGHAPFQRHADLSTEAIVERLRTEPPARLPAGLAPADLDVLLRQALDKDPAARPQTAAGFADALQAIVDAHPAPSPHPASTGAPPPSSPRSAATLDVAVSPPTTSRPIASGPITSAAAVQPPSPGAASPSPAGPNPAPRSGAPGGPSPTPPQPARWAQAKPGKVAAPAASRRPRSPATPTATSPKPGPPLVPGWLRWMVFLVVGAGLLSAITRVGDGADDPVDARVPDDIASLVQPQRPPSTLPATAPSDIEAAALAAVAPLADDQASWAAERATVVAEIAANGWGWDQEAQTMSGPGGLLVDLSACPDVWDPYQGVGPDTVELRQIRASQATPDLIDEAAGFRAYFDHLNLHGGMAEPDGGSRYVVMDDDSLDAGTVQRFLGGDDVEAFATRTITDGAVETLAGNLGSACVPDPFVPSAGPGWSDPAGQPWAWADRLPSEVEGRLVGETLLRSLPDPSRATVVALVTDDDVGRATEQAVRRFLAESDLPDTLVATEVDGLLGFLDEELQLLDTGPDVLLLIAGTPEACARMTGAVVDRGLPATTRVVMQTSGCGPSEPGPTVDGDPSGTSWLAVGRPHRTPQPDDAWTTWAESVLGAAGLGRFPSPAALEGFASGWSLHQALLIAGELPGGLSRPNLVVAARALRLGHPGLVDGVSYGMQGGLDAALIEGAPILRYDPEGPGWVPSDFGVLDVAGLTPPCRWDPQQRLCL